MVHAFQGFGGPWRPVARPTAPPAKEWHEEAQRARHYRARHLEAEMARERRAEQWAENLAEGKGGGDDTPDGAHLGRLGIWVARTRLASDV